MANNKQVLLRLDFLFYLPELISSRRIHHFLQDNEIIYVIGRSTQHRGHVDEEVSHFRRYVGNYMSNFKFLFMSTRANFQENRSGTSPSRRSPASAKTSGGGSRPTDSTKLTSSLDSSSSWRRTRASSSTGSRIQLAPTTNKPTVM